MSEDYFALADPNDGPGPDGHHRVTGECFACLVGVSTGPESHGDHCPMNGGGGPAPRREGRPADGSAEESRRTGAAAPGA